MGDDGPRITDLSSIEPENFKLRNTQFLVGEAHYDQQPHETQAELREEIWRVRNGDLQRVLDEFPTDECLIDQCALWVHAVAGKHFFPDANHRTAIALLRRLLRQNGIETGSWPSDLTRHVRDESHRVRAAIEPVHLDTLYRKDALFALWRAYFETVLDACEEA